MKRNTKKWIQKITKTYLILIMLRHSFIIYLHFKEINHRKNERKNTEKPKNHRFSFIY